MLKKGLRWARKAMDGPVSADVALQSLREQPLATRCERAEAPKIEVIREQWPDHSRGRLAPIERQVDGS